MESRPTASGAHIMRIGHKIGQSCSSLSLEDSADSSLVCGELGQICFIAMILAVKNDPLEQSQSKLLNIFSH